MSEMGTGQGSGGPGRIRALPVKRGMAGVNTNDVAAEPCSRACASALFDLMPVPVFIYDLDGLGILSANEAAVAVYGWPREELLSMSFADIRPPEEIPALLDVISREGASLRVLAESCHWRKNGTRFPVEVTSRPIEIDGRLARLAVVQDVSARKAAESRAREQEQRVSLLARQIPAIVWTADLDLRITASIGAGLPALGLTQGELCGRFLRDVLGPSGGVYVDYHKRALSGESVSYETLYEKHVYQVHIEPRRDLEGHITGIIAMALDVTDQHQIREQARLAESRLRVFAGQIPAVLWSTDRDLRFTWGDGAGLGNLGLRPGEVTGVPLAEYFQNRDPDYEPIAAHRAALSGETVTFETEFQGRAFHCCVEPLLDAHGVVTGTIGAALDITERKRAEEQVQHQAEYDALTDLPNRSLFDRELGSAIDRAKVAASRLAVVFLDLDNFKRVNDALGHLAGDELLRAAANRLKETVRFGDIVSRIGGDEFLLLLPGIDGREGSTCVAEKVLATLSRPFYIQGREIFTSASLGISIFPEDGADPETLIKHADAAMYRAKEAGRSGFQYHHPGDSQRAMQRVSLEGELRRAVCGNGGFVLHYQPQVCLQSGRVNGLEALIRWRHLERGLLCPAEFLGFAEELGLILPIGDWVLGEAARTASAWAENPSLARRPRLAVNIHPFELRERHFLARIDEAMKKTGCDPGLLDFEITESAAMGNIDLSVRVLRQLRERGFHLSIDDFGTGHSSLTYLKLLPVDRVKIDRVFVHDIASDARDRAIVSSVVNLGHALGLSVVAEGVETPEQESCLCDLGCDEAQGYLMSPAVAREDAERLLELEPRWWAASPPFTGEA